MSLAAPTRPLPTSPSNRTTDLPSRSNSISSTSKKNDKLKPGSSQRSPRRGDSESDTSRPERDVPAHSLSPQLTGGSKTGVNGSLYGEQTGTVAGPHIQINNLPEQSVSWGANFWVTIQDPMTQSVFYACPSTGETSWEQPTETFLMPLTDDGHWWELVDEARGGVPYYYHTKTGETQWTRPEGFVIPLGIIQTTTSLGRRFSQNAYGYHQNRNSIASTSSERRTSLSRRSRSYGDAPADSIPEERLSDERLMATDELRRPSNEAGSGSPSSGSGSAEGPTGERSSSPSPGRPTRDPLYRASSSPSVLSTTPPQLSLGGVAAEMFASVAYDEKKRSKGKGKEAVIDLSHSTTPPTSPRHGRQGLPTTSPVSPVARALQDAGIIPPSPKRTLPAVPQQEFSKSPEKSSRRVRRDTEASTANVNGREIGKPVPDPETTKKMGTMKTREGKPIFVEKEEELPSARLSTGDHKILPRPLAADIQQFAVSEFAKRYFSTHKTGLIFKRKVPVEQMMSWQKAPLQAPLLVLNRSLHKDAVKSFKVIQKVMGDRDREKPVGVKSSSEGPSPSPHPGASSTSLGTARETYGIGSVLEEERWMLSEGLVHGELRDEIYCQVIKQLSSNPSQESLFNGWQLLCVILNTFPPSKNLETYLRAFIQERLNQTEGRIDIMAKYCVGRLAWISKKGPRGKPPTIQEIENAADAAFNPSTFGESVESIMRLQLRTYPESKVPIILPFLADSIIALGGSKREGIFRVPGDADVVSEMKVRIDKGHYNLQGVDDPHVPAALLKMWLRELQEPVIPLDMYNEAIAAAEEPDDIIRLVKQLPTINRRVLLFVISFLQLFLPENVSTVTKMTAPSLALVMAPNLLRCDSDSLAVVFNNARFEHLFVHNLLLHLKCHKIDSDYVPTHGMGAGSPSNNAGGRPKSSHRRPGQ